MLSWVPLCFYPTNEKLQKLGFPEGEFASYAPPERLFCRYGRSFGRPTNDDVGNVYVHAVSDGNDTLIFNPIARLQLSQGRHLAGWKICRDQRPPGIYVSSIRPQSVPLVSCTRTT